MFAGGAASQGTPDRAPMTVTVQSLLDKLMVSGTTCVAVIIRKLLVIVVVDHSQHFLFNNAFFNASRWFIYHLKFLCSLLYLEIIRKIFKKMSRLALGWTGILFRENPS